MRIGITGATGFVGTALTVLAGRKGHTVVAYSRNRYQDIAGTEEVRDISQPETADYSGLDALIHLAGEPIFGLFTEEKKKKIRDSRIEGTRKLVAGLKRTARRPPVLVCASATGFYGNRGDEVLDEEADPGFGFLAEVVRGWEAAARDATELGLRVVSGRTGMVLGGAGGAALTLRRIFRLRLGGKLGSGQQWMPWIHIHDLAQAYLAAAENATLSGPVNFVAPDPVRNKEFTRLLARRVNCAAVAWAPAPMLRLVLGEMSEMLLFSQRVEPAGLRLIKFQWKFPGIEAAIRDVF